MNQKNQGIAGKKKTSVLLHLDTSHQRKEDGKSRFYLKVRVQGKPQLYDIVPEVHMDRKYWIHETDELGAEKKKMRIQHSKGNLDSRRLEVTLLGKLGEMIAIIEDLGNQGHAVTHAMVGQRWKGTGIKTLVEYIDARMEDERAEVRASTFIKLRSCLRAIRGYDSQVLLTEVTPEWLRGYEEYMRHTKPHVRILETMGGEKVVKGKGKGLGQNAIVGNFKFLSKYLRDALVRQILQKVLGTSFLWAIHSPKRKNHVATIGRRRGTCTDYPLSGPILDIRTKNSSGHDILFANLSKICIFDPDRRQYDRLVT